MNNITTFTSTLRDVKNKIRFLLPLTATLALSSLSNGASAATCHYELSEQRDNNLRARITITNDSAVALDEWSVFWPQHSGYRVTHAKNANITCGTKSCIASSRDHEKPIRPEDNHVVTMAISLESQRNRDHRRQTRRKTQRAPNSANSQPLSGLTLNGESCIQLVHRETSNNEAPTISNVAWLLDGENSQVQYITTKSDHISETNYFLADEGEPAALEGSIDRLGNAILRIDLNEVHTAIDIRDQRMLDFVFETELLPAAYITTSIDTDMLDTLPVGETLVTNIVGQLSLHAIKQDISTEVAIVKHSETSISVSTVAPILIDSNQFDLSGGIETLRIIANLNSISQTVPVYFRLNYSRNSDVMIDVMELPATPEAPSQLEASYDGVEGSDAILSWVDNSLDESAFLIRRKPIDGYWMTAANLEGNADNYEEALPDSGEFDYKVIAINNGVPSTPSNMAHVVVTEGDTLANGKLLYDVQCASCHGLNGEGVAVFPPVNVPVDINEFIEVTRLTMPLGAEDSCDQACSEAIAEYVQTFWE